MAEMRGIQEYVSADGVKVMLLHYCADPDKNTESEVGQKWLMAMKKGWPGGLTGSKWQQEMEINFGAVSGNRVYPAWDEMLIHIRQEPFEIPENWPLFAAYDYGISNPFSFGVYAIESAERVYKIDEIVKTDTNVYEQARLIKQKPYFDRLRGNIVGDPSIWHRSQHREGQEEMLSIGQILDDQGIVVERGRNDVGVDTAFINMLNGMLWADLDNPIYKIFSTCTATIRSYRNLRWDEARTVLSREAKDLPEGIIRKGVDPFDCDKYFFLSNGFEEPGVVDYRPGTWGWYEEQVRETIAHRARILG